MTPEQEALVEALRLFAADQGIGFDRMHNQMAAGLIEPIGEDLCDSTFSVTPAGRLVLALAAERDLWRLKAEWQERAAYYYRTGIGHDAMIRAKSAYVAAGGVV